MICNEIGKAEEKPIVIEGLVPSVQGFPREEGVNGPHSLPTLKFALKGFLQRSSVEAATRCKGDVFRSEHDVAGRHDVIGHKGFVTWPDTEVASDVMET